MPNNCKNLKLLHVEDNKVNRVIVESMLKSSNLPVESIDEAVSLENAMTILDEKPIDVILLDLNLADSEGLDTLVSVQQNYYDKPIIVVTGELDEEVGLDAISHGAQEYLIKGKFNVDTLSKTIRYAIERKESEQRARINEHILQTLISHLPQRVLLKDKDYRFLSCNAKYAQTIGANPESIIGKTDYDLYPKKAADEYRAMDEEVIQTGSTLERFSRYVNGDIEIITRILKTPVFNDEGTVDGVLCVFEDFTERVKAEESLKLANEHLEESNQQLVEMQSQLVQSEKLASIGQLAAGIAHEINNPISFVTSNCQTLKKYLKNIVQFFELNVKALDNICQDSSMASEEIKKILRAKQDLNIDFIIEDVEELFDDSYEGVTRVTKIVQNLRNFSRVDQAEDFSYYNLNEGIRSTLIVAQNEIKYYSDVCVDLGEIPEVYCNSGQINQVFLNILVNAAQAIAGEEKKEKGEIFVRSSRGADSVEVQISDNGPGIKPEIISKIFDPFFTTKPVGKGTGLGLNLSYDIIVNKHKGQLLVESEIDKGTTFRIILPINCRKQIEVNEESNNGKENCIVC